MLFAISGEAVVLVGLLTFMVLAALRNSRRRTRYLRQEWTEMMPHALRGRRSAIERIRRTLRSREDLRLFQDFIDARFKGPQKPPSLEVRALCRTLGFTDRLKSILAESRDQLERAAAAKTLGHLRERVERTMLEGLLHSDGPAVVLSVGYAAASTRDPSLFLLVLRAVYKRTPITLHGAAELLSRFGPGICPVVQGMLEDIVDRYESRCVEDEMDEETEVSSKDVAAQVIMIDLLAFFGHFPATRALYELLVRTEHDEVLIHIIKAMAKIGGRRAIPRLEPLLRHQNWVVRSQAATTLAALGAREALPLIAGMVDDVDTRVRTAARRAYYSLQEVRSSTMVAV